MKTKLFGEIQVNEDKVISFPNGIIGFDYLKNFMLIHDADNSKGSIMWLQSLEEPAYALPIIDPLKVDEKYNPIIEDDLLEAIGGGSDDELLVFVTIKVPKDITKMTCNMLAPIIVNSASRKGCQLIAENTEYSIQYPVYDIFNSKKGE